jgi:disulfide bond formation protein DsbB
MFSAETISPRHYCVLLVAAAVASLAAVYIGQYFFGLHPCHLCLYQRVPFAIIIALGIAGFFIPRFRMPSIWLSAAALITNAGIALYHSGVERKWWTGLEGCSTPDMSGSIEELMARIQNTAATRCDEIAWELFGLSLANYNFIFCLGLSILTIAYLIKTRPTSRP